MHFKITAFNYCRLYLNFFRLNEFNTTETELSAMAAPAIPGFRNPDAAIGIPAILYANDQNRFCLIFRIVFCDNRIAVGKVFRLLLTRTISAVSIAMSVPEPMAIQIGRAHV